MDPDSAYENSRFIPGGDAYPARWNAEAEAWREKMVRAGQARLDRAYGEGDRQRLDLFLPPEEPRGLVVFVHGGFWLDFDRRSWSHLAAGPVARDWAVALPSYNLAPRARLADITAEIAGAVTYAAGWIDGPLVLTGHSAGGHLAARMACRDVALPAGIAARLARIVAISPLSDLRPLLGLRMNAELGLDAAEAAAESPVLLQPRPVPVTVWVGGDERPAFLDQARWLAEAWPNADLRVEPGRHHFDVIDGLTDPESPLTAALVGGL